VRAAAWSSRRSTASFERRSAGFRVSAGLAEEITAKSNDPIWRHDEETGAPYALKLTAAGAKAIGIDEGAKHENVSDEDSAPR
jgi:hypothetical protein